MRRWHGRRRPPAARSSRSTASPTPSATTTASRPSQAGVELAKLVVVRLPGGAPLVDPDPAETARREVELLDAWREGATAVVGWSAGGWEALELAAGHPSAVERLVLVATPRPEEDVDWLDGVAAKTLLLYGSADPETGSSHARWWQRRLANARVEMSPGGGHDLLAPLWPRILSFVAPGAGKRA